MNEAIIQRKENFEKALAHFAEEASKLRTGRAHPGLVENILVDYYGSKTPLKQIATINIPEARQITIQPWDKNALEAVATALQTSDLGLNPSNDGNLLRLNLPALTEERRKDLVKTLNSRAEEGRIAIRTIREEALQDIQKQTISQDETFRAKEDLQKVVDEYNEKLEALRKKKEEDILTV